MTRYCKRCGHFIREYEQPNEYYGECPVCDEDVYLIETKINLEYIQGQDHDWWVYDVIEDKYGDTGVPYRFIDEEQLEYLLERNVLNVIWYDGDDIGDV